MRKEEGASMDKNKILGVTGILTSSTHRLVALAMVGLLLLVSGHAAVPAEPPEGAVTADIGFPPVGTQLEYETVQFSGKTQRQIFTVLEEGTHNGRPVYRMSDGVETLIYDKATESWVATFRNGKVVAEASPHSGSMSFPLWVGKSWDFRYRYTEHQKGILNPRVTRRCQVNAYEEIKVPAGTFKTFKVRCATALNVITIWYSPELHKFVKSVFEIERYKPGRDKLQDMYKRRTRELLRYRLPGGNWHP
ncbi:MAG: hypothetical protein ACE5MG_07775 [Candidatus Methylomirabilales bacterium]